MLFPRANQKVMFLFVFRVYDDVRGHVKEHLDESVKTELEEWPRFIASNIQIACATLPKVSVVISHTDKMAVRSAGWAENIVKEFRAEFQNVLDRWSSENLYQIGARRKIKLLSSFILKHRRVKGLNDEILDSRFIQLDLCYKVDGILERFCIRIIVWGRCKTRGSHFRGTNGASLEWSSPPGNNQEFVGFHVQCKDPMGASLEWCSPPDNNQEFIGVRVQCKNPTRMSMSAVPDPYSTEDHE